MSRRGKYIVIEGNDGTGKTSQVLRLTKRLNELGIKTLEVFNDETGRMEPIREPGGVPISNELRRIILNRNLERDAWTNVILFTANRRANWTQAIKPALEAGKWVVCSRSWISTAAYQGYGEGMDVRKIKEFVRENIGEEYMKPDYAIVLAFENHDARRDRIKSRGELKNPDTFESRGDDFQTKVDNGYVDFAKSEGIEIIDASGTIEEIENMIWNHIEPLTKEAK